MRSKHFERVLFYSLKIIRPTKTFPGMCDPSSKNSEFPKVVPGPWAIQNPQHWTCAAFALVAETHLAHLLPAAHKNITKCCKCHSSFTHLILTKVHCPEYSTLVNYGGLREMGTPSALSINRQILLKCAGLPALILTQVEHEKVMDNIFLNVMETSKLQRRSKKR